MQQNLTIKTVRLEDNSVLIKKFIKGIEGGRTLDTTDWTGETIPCGTVIASKTQEGAKVYFPLPVEGSAYKVLGEGEKYEGLLYSSILREKPAASIMTWGVVNNEALPVAVPEDFKTACPHIDYQSDEEA